MPLEVCIDVLLDSTAPYGDRYDAAMELEKFDDPKALEALQTIAADHDEDDILTAMCGESIGYIWARQNNFSEEIYARLTPSAKMEIRDVIEIQRPEWIERYNMD